MVRHESEAGMQAARRQIHQMLQADDVEQAVRDMGKIKPLNLDELKLAEYALLVGPVSQGMINYLEAVDQGLYLPPVRISPEPLTIIAGQGLARETLAVLEQDPHLPYLDAIAKRRKEKGGSVHLYPVDKLIIEAAQSAVDTTAQAAAANASALRLVEAHTGDPQAFMDSVKRSTDLVLRRPLIHLYWHMAVNRSTSEFIQDSLVFGEADEHKLRYDPMKDEVLMDRPLEEWQGTPEAAHEMFGIPVTDWRIGDAEVPDVRIGCPITFEPKLVVEFYGQIVDLIDNHSIIDLSGHENRSGRLLDLSVIAESHAD